MESELRKDLIVNRWVLISPRRGKRPNDYHSRTTKEMQELGSGPCAFCLHHEHETGPELLAFQNDVCPPNGPCWRVRVVENKYPAVSPQLGDASDFQACEKGEGLLKDCCIPGFGSHEVVIDTPDHDKLFLDLSVDQIGEVLKAYQSRLETLRSDNRYKYIQIFKNHGNAAGASMVHSHSQIIALPIIPKAAAEEFDGTRAFYERNHSCVYCETIRFDLEEDQARLIDKTEDFITMAPFASRFPYETWILPRRHSSNFGSIPEEQVKGLAEILKLTLKKMDIAFNKPPYNFILQTAPLQDCNVPYFHWYIRILPHLVSMAGFELGSGCHINPVAPEAAAELLRGIDIKNQSDSNGNHESGPKRLIYMAELEPGPKRLIHMADI